MATVDDELGRCPAKQGGHLPRAALYFMVTVFLAACGGGGGGGGDNGGGGGGGGPREALTFLEPDTFANGRVYETSSGSLDFLGGFNSEFVPALDCTNSSNFTPRPFLEIRWTNLATNESGAGYSTIFCIDNGVGGTGVRARWLTDFIALAVGQNIIQFDVIDGGEITGRNRVTVRRVDSVAPTVSFVSPGPDSTDVATNSPVVVVFSEAMNENSLDASRLTLESADGTTIAGVHSYDPASFMWKFEPGSSLSAGGTYTATVSAGVTDSFGVAMISDVQWQFTAGTSIDNTGPQVVATWPAAPCQCSPPTTRIVLLADEPLDPTATLVVADSQQNPVAGQIIYQGRGLEFVPDSPLVPNESYSATADGLRDLLGNTAPATTWEFGTDSGLSYGSWDELAAPPISLSGAVMASDNTSVFAFGSFGSFDATQFRGYYYQSSADEWQPLADLLPDGATSPEPRLSPTVIWNGAELLVYGGFDSVSRPQDDGGAYHPATDTWRVLSGSWRQSNPTRITEILGLAGHSALWTGAEMLIWGGLYETTGDGELTNRGWTYDPASGLWAITGPEPTIDDNFRLIPDDSAPAPRSGHDAIWTGSEMIVWGGVDAAGEPLADGGRYDPATDSWQPVATLNAPLTTPMTEAQWTGIEMLTWNGGQVVAPEFGGVPLPGIYLRGYDPLSDTWRTPDSAWEPAFLPDTRFFLLGSGSTVIAVGFDDREAFPRTLAAYSFDTATDQWRVGDTLDVPFCDIDAATYHLGQVYVSCSGRIYRFTP